MTQTHTVDKSRQTTVTEDFILQRITPAGKLLTRADLGDASIFSPDILALTDFDLIS